MSDNVDKNKAKKIFSILKKEYPKVKPELEFSNSFELLIATILSAQCTDERVNKVCKILFKKYHEPKDFLRVNQKELEKDIFSTGFYHQKAKNIIQCCKILVDKYDSKVPENFENLTQLPGVGRKTASVVAGNAFGIPSIAVDTHVKRLSNLLGFINSDNPEEIESKLRDLLPMSDWINSSHYLAMHGRKICIARKPQCMKCVLADECPGFNSYYNKL